EGGPFPASAAPLERLDRPNGIGVRRELLKRPQGPMDPVTRRAHGVRDDVPGAWGAVLDPVATVPDPRFADGRSAGGSVGLRQEEQPSRAGLVDERHVRTAWWVMRRRQAMPGGAVPAPGLRARVRDVARNGQQGVSGCIESQRGDEGNSGRIEVSAAQPPFALESPGLDAHGACCGAESYEQD